MCKTYQVTFRVTAAPHTNSEVKSSTKGVVKAICSNVQYVEGISKEYPRTETRSFSSKYILTKITEAYLAVLD